MAEKFLPALGIVLLLCAIAATAQAQAQAPAERQDRMETQIEVQSQARQGQFTAPDLSGSYRCEPQPLACRIQTFSVRQSERALELKGDNGEVAEARFTSASTLSAGPPWNMIGVIRNGGIDWSNGTRWVRQ